MSYNTSSLFATVELFLVITSSLTHGPIVDFSCSFQASSSLSGGMPAWREVTHSISKINRLVIVSSSLTGSSVDNYLTSLSQSGVNSIPTECNSILTSFISSSNIPNLFTGSGITLT